jgi:hypothetical protein
MAVIFVTTTTEEVSRSLSNNWKCTQLYDEYQNWEVQQQQGHMYSFPWYKVAYHSKYIKSYIRILAHEDPNKCGT